MDKDSEVQEIASFYKDFFEQSKDLFIITDLQGGFIKVNKPCEELLAHKLFELKGTSILEHIHPEDVQKAVRHIKDVHYKGRLKTCEIRMLGHQGKLYYLEFQTLRRDDTLISLVRDLTKYRGMEDDYKTLNHLHFTVLNTISVGLIYAQNSRFEWANAAFLQMFKTSIEDIRGQHLSLFYKNPEDFKKIHEEALRLFYAGKSYYHEIEVTNQDESISWISFTGKALSSQNPEDGTVWMIQDISSQKLAYQQLEESKKDLLVQKKLLSDTQRLAKVGSWEVNLQNGIGSVSEEVYELLGYKNKTEVITLETIVSMIHPDNQQDVAGIISSLGEIDRIDGFAFKLLRVDGIVSHLQIVAEIEKNKEGIPVRALGAIQDISEIMEINDALRISEHKNIGLLNSAPIGIGIVNNRSFKQVNKHILELTEYTEVEILNLNTKFLYPSKEEYLRVADQMIMQFKTRNTASIETSWITKSGKLKKVLITTTPIDPDRVSRELTVTVLDITAQKDIEKEKNKTLWFLENLNRVNNVLYKDNKLDVMMRNVLKTTFEIFESDRVYLQHPIDLDEEYSSIPMEHCSPDYPGVEGHYKKLKVTPGLKNLFKELLFTDGVVTHDIGDSKEIEDFPWEKFKVKSLMSMVLYPRKGKPWQLGLHSCRSKRSWTEIEKLLFFEIGQRVSDALTILLFNEELLNNELKLKKLNEELEQRVKDRTDQLLVANHELEAFAYSVSHDLRAPLRHIDGFLNLLQRSLGPLEEKNLDYFTKIQSSSKTMSVMIDELLKFSRLGRTQIQKKEVDLNPMVKSIAEEMSDIYGNRSIEWYINDISIVQGDPNLLKMVLINLISNAVKYSSRKEKSIIEIGEGSKAEDHICFYVKDNGAGFDMAYKEKVFGVFQRLHRSEEFEGTGIGMANVKQILSKHQGSIDVESAIDKGTTFYIKLPKAK